MAALGAVGVRLDPVLVQNFVISLIDSSSTLSILKTAALAAVLDVALGGFSECTGLEMALQVEEYKEGGRAGAVLKFPTRVTWTNLTLKKGVGAGTGLWDWHYGFVEGKGKRRDGIIVLLTDCICPTTSGISDAACRSIYSGPTFNATQNVVAIESIEIAHEGIYQVPFVGYASAAVGFAANIAVG